MFHPGNEHPRRDVRGVDYQVEAFAAGPHSNPRSLQFSLSVDYVPYYADAGDTDIMTLLDYPARCPVFPARNTVRNLYQPDSKKMNKHLKQVLYLRKTARISWSIILAAHE